MIVYVESNFCLELVFQQEEEVHARDILELAEAGRLELVFPQLAICEPFSTLSRYDNQRRKFLDELNLQLSELDRSAPQQPVVASTQPLVTTLARIGQDQANRLEKVVERMLRCGRSIPLTVPLFSKAQQLESRFGLSAQDAIVASSVLGDLDPRKSAKDSHAFLSRNSKDFSSMKEEFSVLGCRYIPKFEHGLQFIRAKI